MAALPDSHFSPLRDFELAWRWTDPRWAVLPPEVLAEIRSFTAQAAAGFGREATRLCMDAALHASSRIATDAVGEEETVAAWLAALPISPSTWVIVSWHDHLAVQTRWSIFARYWDDFCYPSSDDVGIWSPEAQWALCYHHDEVFHFQSHSPA
jgi:hypothetical protein